MTRETPTSLEPHESVESSIAHILVHISSYAIIAVVFGALAWLYKKPNAPTCQPVGGLYGCLHSNSFVHWLCNAPTNPTPLLPVHVSSGAPAKQASKETKEEGGRGLHDVFNLLFCFMGLQVSYVSWGYFQERIMTIDYGNGARFDNSEFLVFLNRIAAVMLAIVLNWVRGQPSQSAPPYVYSFASMSNVMSSWFQYEALKFVSFPLQVLSKSSKILFTMLMGKVVSGRSFPTADYINAAMIGVGLTIYRISEPTDTEKGKPEGYFWVGIALLMGYIIADSFTSTWQQDIFQKYKVSQTQMMMGINCYSAALSMGMLLLHNSLFSSWWFLMAHPQCLAHCVIMSSCSALGQIFIYRTIQHFGAVVFATFMTSRQLISIVVSVYSFDHALQAGGVFGLAMVFTALGIKVRQEFLAKKSGGGGGKGGKGGAAAAAATAPSSSSPKQTQPKQSSPRPHVHHLNVSSSSSSSSSEMVQMIVPSSSSSSSTSTVSN